MTTTVDTDTPTGTWTRQQTSDRLGISVATVRRMEDRGELHAIVNEDGVHRFDPAEVEELARARAASVPEPESDEGPVAPIVSQGQLDAVAFKAFAEGRTPTEVVIETEQPASVVRAQYEAYAKLGDLLLLPRSEVRRILGREPDPEGLVRYLEVLGALRMAAQKPCLLCGKPMADDVEARLWVELRLGMLYGGTSDDDGVTWMHGQCSREDDDSTLPSDEE